MQIIKTDVLIIGGGGAASRAAVAAHDGGAETLMVLKGILGESGATSYRNSEMGGFTVPDGYGDPTDSPDVFFDDVITAGLGMADPQVVRVLADNASRAKEELENWGLPFIRVDGGRYKVSHGCFASKSRGYGMYDHGRPIVNTLMKQIRERGIRVMENAIILALLVKDGVCVGATGLDENDQQVVFDAKAVVMGTGGNTGIFKWNNAPGDITGDGYAIAHRAGIRLCNMEFMQGGVAYSHPKIGALFCYMWSGLPELRNGRGERFLHKYLPEGVTEADSMREHANHFPFSSRDVSKYIDISIQKEIAEGRGTEHGGIVIDFSKFTPEYTSSVNNDMRVMWPITVAFYRKLGMDFEKDQIELAPFGHAVNGGIKIDKSAASSMPGLFAAGETSAGPHGADRLGGSMLMGCQVFGRIAGESAAAYAAKEKGGAADARLAKAQSESVVESLYKTVDLASLDQRLKETASDCLLIRRTEAGLTRMLETLDSLDSELNTAAGGGRLNRANAMLQNMIYSARLMSRSAIQRRESRGSHYREDYPELDEAFNKPIYLD